MKEDTFDWIVIIGLIIELILLILTLTIII